MVFGYIEIREDRERANWQTANGPAVLSIVGELEGDSIPAKWKGVYNVRYQKHVTIRKDNPNNSSIIFKRTPKVNIVESSEDDTDDSNYKRSYIVLETDRISTYGAKIDSIDVSIRDDV